MRVNEIYQANDDSDFYDSLSPLAKQYVKKALNNEWLHPIAAVRCWMEDQNNMTKYRALLEAERYLIMED